ncbi:MAG: hypothetical protein J0M20_06400, partial [Burkholderiales bacterium]|nr:hypothetical protein [Burkholderiales bacterium]
MDDARGQAVAAGDSADSRWSLRSLQGRLLWSMLLVLVLALGGLGLRTAADASRRLHLEADARARAAARSVALTIENPLLTQQFDQVEEALLRLALMPGLRELRVTDGHGHLISQVLAPDAGEPQAVFGQASRPLTLPADLRPSTRLQQQPGGEAVLVAWHPVGSGSPVGWVQAVHSLEELDSLQREVVVRTGATAAAAVLLGGLALWGLLRAPLAYLRQAGRLARQLRRADG